MRFYIGDCHFFHANLNKKMDNRGFESVEEMKEYMIKKWNERAKRNDEIVITGDFSIGNATETEEILKRLKGKKYLVEGNHDKFVKDPKFDRDLFVKIVPSLEINDEKRKVIACHYPVFCYNGQNRINENGDPKSYMLYGHVHNTYDEVLVNDFINKTKNATRDIKGITMNIPCNMINCFCMFSDYSLLTLDEWIDVDKIRRNKIKGIKK